MRDSADLVRTVVKPTHSVNQVTITPARQGRRRSRVHRRVRRWSNLGLRIGLWLLIGFSVVAVARAYFDETYTLGAFDVPTVLANAGYTREVVPRRIHDAMLAIQAQSSSVRDFSEVAAGQRASGVDVQVAGFGVSFESLAQRLREVTGRTQRTFGGELTLSADTVYLALRQNGLLLATYAAPLRQDSSLEGPLRVVFAKAARGVYRETEPYLYAVLLDDSPDSTDRREAMRIATSLITNGEASEKPWAYNFLGNAARERGDTLAAKAYFWTALREDPSFRLGYNNLYAIHTTAEDVDSMRATYALAKARLGNAERDLFQGMEYSLSLVTEDEELRQRVERDLLDQPTRSEQHEQSLLMICNVLLNRGEVLRANELFYKILELYPFSEPTLANLIVVNLMLERWPEAERALRRYSLVVGDSPFTRGAEGWLTLGQDSVEAGKRMLLAAYAEPELARYSGQFQPLSSLYLAYRTGDTTTQRAIATQMFATIVDEPVELDGVRWLRDIMDAYFPKPD